MPVCVMLVLTALKHFYSITKQFYFEYICTYPGDSNLFCNIPHPAAVSSDLTMLRYDADSLIYQII